MTTEQRVADGFHDLSIELPSWAFGNSGTRFKVFAQKGVPRNPYEKIADAAQVHMFTGLRPRALPCTSRGTGSTTSTISPSTPPISVVRIGAINSNVFQDDDYMLGSVTNPDPRIRRKATDHLLECIDIMDATGSRDLKLWFSDGTNYPGQDDIHTRQDRLAEALAEVYQRLGDDQRFLLEYKLFEPALLHDGRSRLGHRLRALHRPRSESPGGHRHRPSRAGHQHRVHRGHPAARGKARWFRLQLAASTPTTT